jgi:hypothetical protein
MKRLIEFLRYANRPCREMSTLASAAFDERLPWPQRWAYRLHLLYCTACRRYRKQILALRLGLRRIGVALRADDPGAGPALSAAARERIARALRSA